MAAEIKTFSYDYLDKSFDHPYGEDIKNSYAGAPVRIFSRGASYLLSISILSLYGFVHHGMEAIVHFKNGDIRAKHLSACTIEVLKLANTVAVISAALLLLGSTSSMLKTFLVSYHVLCLLMYLTNATYAAYGTVMNEKKVRDAHMSTMWENIAYVAQSSIGLGLCKYVGIKSLAGISMILPIADFAAYSLGVQNFAIELNKE